MTRRLASAALSCLIVVAAGCATPPRDPVVASPLTEPVPGIALQAFAYTSAERNGWIEANVIRIDDEFHAFRRELQSWRTNANVTTSLVALLANVASTLTGSAGVKANYTALNSLATGVDGIVDREQFLEQTVSALVAAMEGRRAQIYTRIRVGMAKETREYALVDAHRDVQAYAAAGRLEEGMKFVVAATEDARDQAVADGDAKIAAIVAYTDEERQLTACATHSIVAIPEAKEPELRAVLADLGVTVPADADLDALKRLFLQARQNAPAEFQRDVVARLTRAGLLLAVCPEY